MSTASHSIRVLLADDHAIMRQGLQVLLEQSDEFEVVGQASDGTEAVRAALKLTPDVIVMDVMMPNKDGVEACREIMESLPDTRVIMLTASTEEDAVIEAVAAGATGYLQKVSGLDQLANAVRVVAAGEMRVPAHVVTRVFAGIRDGVVPGEGRPELTQREEEILASFSGACHTERSRSNVESSPLPSGTRSTPYRASSVWVPSRRSWSGPCGTDCWTTDRTVYALFPGSLPPVVREITAETGSSELP